MERKIPIIGCLSAVAVIFSYVEIMIGFDFILPGIKLGLCNVVLLIAIYIFGFNEAFIISIIRITIILLFFGNLNLCLYSLGGSLVSLLSMYITLKVCRAKIHIVSVVGAVFHNIGQLLIAALILQSFAVKYYFLPLIVSGIFTGLIIGEISSMTLKKIDKLDIQGKQRR